ncbi:MAG TPA: 1-acyl-sn-glycerol-3-phosphate acyltransferase, partial [Micromonosporaceae bacterium]
MEPPLVEADTSALAANGVHAGHVNGWRGAVEATLPVLAEASVPVEPEPTSNGARGANHTGATPEQAKAPARAATTARRTKTAATTAGAAKTASTKPSSTKPAGTTSANAIATKRTPRKAQGRLGSVVAGEPALPIVTSATAPAARPASKAAAPTARPAPAPVTSRGRPDAWDERVAGMLSFLRRRLTGQYEVDEFGFDPELTRMLVHPVLRLLKERYFRIETSGVENLPSKGSALLVANHSGTLPMDALMLSISVHDDTPAHRHLRLLGADLVFR